MTWRAVMFPIVSAACIAASVATGSARAGAAPPDVSSFTVSARADSIALEVVDPKVPLFPNGEITYATPGTAQASVNSLGESTAYASSPDPGDAIAGLPSLANGLLGTYGLAVFPAYPLIVNTSYPEVPTGHLSLGLVDLTSASTANASAAGATTGLGGLGAAPRLASVVAHATTAVDPATGVMTATADDETDGLAIGSTLVISDISAHAALRRVPGQAPVETTSFSVGSVTIAGITVGFTDKGFQIGTAALPSLTPAALTGLLSAAGISLTYLPSTRTADGIDSAGLEVGFETDVPSQGIVHVTLTLGHVAVSAPAVVAAPSLTPTSAPPAVSQPTSSGTAPIGALTGGPPPSPPSPAAAPVTGAPPRSPAVAAPTVPAVAVLAHPFVGDLTNGLFWLLAALAAALVIAAAVLRRRDRPAAGPGVLRLPGRSADT